MTAANEVLSALGLYREGGRMYVVAPTPEILCVGCAFEHAPTPCDNRPCDKGILVEVANDDTGR